MQTDIYQIVTLCSSTVQWVLGCCAHVVHLFLRQDCVKMAEGSRDQGGVATTDPEEDSPNMIVYRKVRLTLCVCYTIWPI